MMKKIIALSLVVLLSFAGIMDVSAYGDNIVDEEPIPLDENANLDGPFFDVWPNDWYYDAAGFMRETGFMGVLSGEDFNFFLPGEKLQRQDVAVIFGRIYKELVNNEVDLSMKHKPYDYYVNYVKWVNKYHIMNGYADGNFGVGDDITREDFATSLYNFVMAVAPFSFIPEKDPGVLGSFADKGDVRDYSYDAMYWMVGNGIIQGYENDGVKTIQPQGTVTRGMAAVMLQRFFESYEDEFKEYGNKDMLL